MELGISIYIASCSVISRREHRWFRGQRIERRTSQFPRPKREIDGFLSSSYAKTPSGERDRQAPRLLITIFVHIHARFTAWLNLELANAYFIATGRFTLGLVTCTSIRLLKLACFPIPFTIKAPATRPSLPPRATRLFSSY
jgi:hypothetical protein